MLNQSSAAIQVRIGSTYRERRLSELLPGMTRRPCWSTEAASRCVDATSANKAAIRCPRLRYNYVASPEPAVDLPVQQAVQCAWPGSAVSKPCVQRFLPSPSTHQHY